MIRRLTILFVAFAFPAFAQDDGDRGFIAGLLEDSLGGPGRIVRVEGFSGALSATARIERISIADNRGVWLELNAVEMTWNRSALLRGRIDIDQLRAAEIMLSRTPEPVEGTLPSAAASGFSLPELPVSVEVAELAADRIVLGAPLFGEPVILSLSATVVLSGGEGRVDLNANRTDGTRGMFQIDGSYANATQMLSIAMNLDEAEEGIAARAMNLPGLPSVTLDLTGEGALTDFAAELALRTDGTPRLEGQMALREMEDNPGARAFDVDLGGDVTALFAPEFRDFFGPDVELVAQGHREADGALTLDQMDLTTKALELRGMVALNREAWPERFEITGRLADATGAAVILPAGGAQTRIGSADFDLRFDAAISNRWEGLFRVNGLDRDDLDIETITLDGSGTLMANPGGIGAFNGDLVFESSGLQFSDPALADAVGDGLQGRIGIRYVEDQPIDLPTIRLSGEGYSVDGEAQISGHDDAFRTDFALAFRSLDIRSLSAIAGRPLGGRVTLDLEGQADLGGFFDVQALGTTRDLRIGVDGTDEILRGESTLSLNVRRDDTGLEVRQANIRTQGAPITLAGTGRLTGAEQDLGGEFDISLISPDIQALSTLAGRPLKGALDLNLEGSATVKGLFDIVAAGSGTDLSVGIAQADKLLAGETRLQVDATRDAAGLRIDDARIAGNGVRAQVDGSLAETEGRFDYEASIRNIRRLVPAVTGDAAWSGNLVYDGETWQVQTNGTGPYSSTVSVNGRVLPDPSVNYTVSLPNVAPIAPGFSGPLRLNGQVRDDAGRILTNTSINGPAGTTARLEGQVSPSFDLSLNANAPLGLASPFIAPRSIRGQLVADLAVRGNALNDVSGRVTISNANFVSPNEGLTLQQISGGIDLGRGRAILSVTGQPISGGQLRVSGPVTLSGRYPADLAISLDQFRLEDPQLYTTSLDGQVNVTGPLRGGASIVGQINVGETQITVPSTSIGSFSSIPNIRHVGSPPEVTATRRRAGLIQDTSTRASSNRRGAYPLDIVVSAPSRIFVRGRGLDAELGGRLALTGTTTNIISAGGFELVRGRLDIVGQRFVLDEGRINLEGDFDPFLNFRATTDTDDGTASVIIEGRASEPQVRFEASPSVPQDEVLAQLLFGRDVSQISAFQALQLANAVATLAGREGVSLLSRLREGFALDDLDVQTSEDGGTAVRAGRYISDNIYTDVTVGDGEDTGVSLNIDITPNLTARGTTGTDGSTSLGIFFERDY
ncbi:MAG: translocation/assembly module TamB domain-containing protein [Pseudomonadota bacterium]